MADCCAQLQAELAALRVEVAKLGKVDEESIITKAFNKSKDYLEPIIGGVSGVAIAAGVKATSAYSLGEVASIKAGSAFSQATAAGKVAQVAQKASLAAEFAAASAGVRATQATGLAKVAQGAATVAGGAAAAASAFAKTALGKALLALTNIAAVVGSIAGLFALYATLKIVFPRLDAHDAQLDSQQRQISKNSSDIFKAQQQIKKIQAQVNDVQTVAERGLNEAYNANRKIDLLKPKVEDVTTRVDRIEPKLEDVASKVRVLTPKVDDVTTRVDRAEPKLEDVTTKVKILTPKVDEAQKTADYALSTAVTIKPIASEALKEAQELRLIVDRVEPKLEDVVGKVRVLTPKVEDAQTTANFAFSTAVTIRPIALDALKEAKEVRPISEQALADSFLSLNKIKVVEPVANDAFTATKLQATQLQGTKLEVGKLGTVTRDQGKRIELNTKDIDGLKVKTPTPPPIKIPTPDTTEKDRMNDKTLKDIQGQIGLLAIAVAGITAVLKPIGQDTTPAAIGNAVAPAVCRTTQPGGCMSNLANNVANNATNNLRNNLGNALNTGANAAQLLLLRNIQAGVNTANTKLGPLMRGANGISGFLGRLSSSLGVDRALNLIAIASNLHNAMMLSSNLKITLLEVLSSVGNATGLLQTSDGDNVDLNTVFNQGIEQLITMLIGVDNYAGLKVGLRKHSSIFRAANNVLSNTGNMFSSLGNGIEVIGERTGKIGNAIRAAGMVRENAYQWMSEKMTVHTNKFMTFQTKIGDVTEILETVNEIAQSTIEGQQSYTEAVKATTEFKKVLEEGTKEGAKDAENLAIKAEAAKIKENVSKDPTGEKDSGYLSFLTD